MWSCKLPCLLIQSWSGRESGDWKCISPAPVGGQSAKTLLGVYKPCDTKPLLMSMYLCVSLFVCGTGVLSTCACGRPLLLMCLCMNVPLS